MAREVSEYASIRIKLASPELIKSWSYGEVKKAETINYRTQKPEKDGLFCERIFGTTKDWECNCGKFKSIRYKGVVCERCGVEVTSNKVRRERMGHITLATAMSHIWFYKSNPSRIALILGITKNELRRVVYYEGFIVMSPGDTDLKKYQVLDENQYRDYLSRFGEGSFRAESGAEAVRELLAEINLDNLSKSLREEIQKTKKEHRGDSVSRQKILQKLEIIENLKSGGNRPEWMVLTIVPVIPPDLRPLVCLEGGRFASSDINDLYRRVITRNNRLKTLLDIMGPDIIVKNEKRLLQMAVDCLLDNSAVDKPTRGKGKRPLKSLSDALKGKQGRFRQNLLGKRVDFSGRTVIVIGPELRMHQCGLPSVMAMELFKPFLLRRLVNDELAGNITKAKAIFEEGGNKIWEMLEEVVHNHPVLLNRAPTLHRLSIEAFEPVLVDGKAIKLHPLVCKGFNADFDGDQMSVHVPLTLAAQIECWTLMLSVRNLLDPANGNPIALPSQDMVLGIYYLTKALPDRSEHHKYFDNVPEIIKAIENHSVLYNENIEYKIPETQERILTTPGRVIFNDSIPDGIPFQNKCLGSKELKKLINDVLKDKTNPKANSLTVKLLDQVKDCGFKNATKFGATISISDIILPSQKDEIIDKAGKQEAEINNQFKRGIISKEERYNKVIDLWTKANEDLSNDLMLELKDANDGFNPLFMMADSGARGSKTQISQLGGMRGLMSKPSGEVIDFPIKSNFKEGLSIMEFFISTNGARKGLADTALKTSKAGHLTRRLVDVSQDVVITIDDCGTINGVYKSAIMDGDKVVESLAERIVGCYCLENITNPVTGELIVGVNQEITEEIAAELERIGIETVLVRSVLTCEAPRGLCKKCYGKNLANNRMVDIGEAVGVVAAQSIGQPGTQLTMRTFHTGGTASTTKQENRIVFAADSIVDKIQGDIVVRKVDKARVFTRKGHVFYRAVLEKIKASNYLVNEGDRVVSGLPVAQNAKKDIVATSNGFAHIEKGTLFIMTKEQKVEIKPGSTIAIKEGEFVHKDDTLVEFDQFSEPIIVEEDGIVEYKDIESGSTLIEELIEESGEIVKHISDRSNIQGEPSVLIKDKKGNLLQSYLLPAGCILSVDEGQEVQIGDVLAKMAKSGIKTNDITGGLPRIEELVEARHPSPKDVAVLSKISGVVKFEGIERKQRVIFVNDNFGNKYKHLVPLSKHILVRDGDRVEAAEKLCDGSIDPHDLLEILGESELREYLVNQIRDVYRAQDANINEKHCGIVVRQMLRKVRIIKIGDTNFVQNQYVDKKLFNAENERVVNEGGVPAVAAPLLQGITRAALSNNSFIASASFQETSKVLTNAAISGSVDYLEGLKENVVVGQLIPAGTGMRCYRNGIELEREIVDNIDEKIKYQHLLSGDDYDNYDDFFDSSLEYDNELGDVREEDYPIPEDGSDYFDDDSDD